MAHERLGKAYEALIYMSLEDLVRDGRLRGTVHWNKSIDGLSVEPDLWIEERGKPSILLLVAHSDSRKNANMKFWRNICEIGEIKTGPLSNTMVGSVYCETQVAESLARLERLLFDFYLSVPEVDDAGDLRRVSQAVAESRMAVDEFVTGLRTALDRGSRKRFATAVLNAIALGRKRAHKASGELWPTIRRRIEMRPRPRLPDEKVTSVRRGIAKLLVAENPRDLVDAVETPAKTMPSYLIRAGFVAKSIAGLRTSDAEIVSTVKLLGKDRSLMICNEFAQDPDVQVLVQPLRDGFDTIDDKVDIISRNLKKLGDGAKLHSLLVATHAKASKRGDKAAYYRPGWLLQSILAILKQVGKRRQAYGYSRVTSALRQLSGRERAGLMRAAIAAGLGGPHELRASSTIEYGLRDWLFGDARTNFDLRAVELFAIAHVLAREIRSVVASITPELTRKALEQELRDLLEFQVVTYRKIQPVKSQIESALREAALPFKEVLYFPTGIAERAICEGVKLNARASSTHVIVCRRTLIRWISVSDEGRDHKRKEFAARGCLLPIQWDSSARQYRTHLEIDRLLIVVDGTFRSSDLESFGRLGWDGVYYPDEMTQLVGAIV